MPPTHTVPSRATASDADRYAASNPYPYNGRNTAQVSKARVQRCFPVLAARSCVACVLW